jgi:hypothetical protein
MWIPNWRMGLRMYSVRTQLVALALTVLTLTGVDRQPLLGMLWLLIALQASAVLARFVAQPEVQWEPTKPPEEETL